jgi:hypothetical protein
MSSRARSRMAESLVPASGAAEGMEVSLVRLWRAGTRSSHPPRLAHGRGSYKPQRHSLEIIDTATP